MSLVVFEGINDLKSWVSVQNRLGRRVGFVPTMGALHPGHLSLLSKAREICDVVVVSIFVNPTQFNNPDDLNKYPRTLESDTEMLANAGCDALFHPAVDEMYPKEYKGHWDFGALSETLEAKFRPGHFDGVLTIVKKLFEVVTPDVAFFGEKDFQQLALIRKMTAFEGLPIQIVGCPAVREESGLAMSSRNMRLSSKGLFEATAISRVLFEMKNRQLDMSPRGLVEWGKTELSRSEGVELEYLELVFGDDLEPVMQYNGDSKMVILVAAYVENVRLIDNISL